MTLLWRLLPLAPLLAAAGASRLSGSVAATPHDSYSSSAGVLGCKINTDRVAYWPQPLDCDSVCVSVSHGGRRLRLLRIDQSAGAFDMSYDAWNYLVTGRSAREQPTAGGSVAMDFEHVDAGECADLLRTRGLPLSAANGLNFLAGCLRDAPDSWVARHHVLLNIVDPLCTLGHDEECALPALDAPPNCSHALGAPDALHGRPVVNIRYPTGERVLASTGQPAGDDAEGGGARRPSAAWALAVTGLLVMDNLQ